MPASNCCPSTHSSGSTSTQADENVTLVNITGLQGAMTPFADGHFNFTPTTGFTGTFSFTYTVGDGFGGSAWNGQALPVAPPVGCQHVPRVTERVDGELEAGR